MANVGVANFRIPNPWDKSSPSFDGETASSLRKFIRNLRTIFTQGGIATDAAKKAKTLEYLQEDDVIEQWERLPTYTSGTFDEWVAEIEGFFPELEDAKVGSLKKMRRICSEHQDVPVNDLGAVRRFSIAFVNEADKLLMPPAALDNGQLVDMYLDCLEESFANNINAIIMQSKFFANGTTATPAAAVNAGAGAAVAQPVSVKRRGDKVPLAFVIKTAKEMAEYWDGHSSKRSKKGSAKGELAGKEVAIKLEEDARENRALLDGINALTAVIKDSFTIQDKKLDQWMKTSFSQAVTNPPPQENSNNGQGSYNKSDKGFNQGNRGFHGNSNNSGPGRCWYCELVDHLMATCQYKREHIEMGYIGFENGSLRLSNGQFIPKYPENKSKKERVDDYWFAQGKKRGATLPLQSQNLVNTSDDRVDHIYDSRDDELLSLKVQVQALARTSNSGQPVLNQTAVNIPQPIQGMIPIPQFATPQFIQMPTAPTGSMDFGQLCNLVDAYRGGQQADQFVATRSGSRPDANSSPNF